MELVLEDRVLNALNKKTPSVEIKKVKGPVTFENQIDNVTFTKFDVALYQISEEKYNLERFWVINQNYEDGFGLSFVNWVSNEYKLTNNELVRTFETGWGELPIFASIGSGKENLEFLHIPDGYRKS